MVNINRIVMYAVGFFLVGILFPIGLSEIANATTTNWDDTVVTVFQVVLPIIAVIGVAIDYIKGPE